MGDVGHAPSCPSPDRGKEFDEAENNDEVLGGNRKEKINIDKPVGEEPAEGQEQSVNGPGGSNDRDTLIEAGREEGCTDSCSNTAEKEVLCELFGSPGVLQLSTEHPEGQEIEKEMGDPAVKKDVSDKLPQKISAPNPKRNQAEVDFDPSSGKQLEEKDHSHNDHQIFNHRC